MKAYKVWHRPNGYHLQETVILAPNLETMGGVFEAEYPDSKIEKIEQIASDAYIANDPEISESEEINPDEIQQELTDRLEMLSDIETVFLKEKEERENKDGYPLDDAVLVNKVRNILGPGFK